MINQFAGEFRFLSNFYTCPAPIPWHGRLYSRVENAYQAEKTQDYEAFLDISAAKAKELGNTLPKRPDWIEISLPTMEQLLEIKFSNPRLRELLLKTGTEELIEGNTWHDNFWGVCGCNKCRPKLKLNNLGKLLMKVREKIRNEKSALHDG